MPRLRPCKRCNDYQNGQGTDNCLSCELIDILADGNMPLKEALLDSTSIPISVDYNKILADNQHQITFTEHQRALAILSTFGFSAPSISTLFHVSERTIRRQLCNLRKKMHKFRLT